MAVGFICVAGSAILLGIMPTMQKQLLVNGLSTYSLLFYTNLITNIVCLILIALRKRSLKVYKKQLIQCILMGVFGQLLTGLLLNTSYLYLPVGTTTMLNFLYPAIVCVVMGVLFKEGFTKLKSGAIVLSILGMVFLTGAGGEMLLIGVILAAASAFTYSGYLIANEKGPANELPIEVKLLYITLPGTLLYLLASVATGTFGVPAGGISGWLMLIVGSGLFSAGGFFLMIYGISKLGAATASFVSMLEPVVSVVFSTIWFHDPVTLGVVVGGLLVFCSIFLIAVDGAKKEKVQKVSNT